MPIDSIPGWYSTLLAAFAIIASIGVIVMGRFVIKNKNYFKDAPFIWEMRSIPEVASEEKRDREKFALKFLIFWRRALLFIVSMFIYMIGLIIIGIVIGAVKWRGWR